MNSFNTMPEALAGIIGTVIGTVVAVVLAVIIQPWQAARTAKRNEQEQSLRAILMNRNHISRREYLNAFHLIPLDFRGRRSILEAHARYLKHSNSVLPEGDEEKVVYVKDLYRLQGEMIREMGRSLGYRFSDEDLHPSNFYIPGSQAQQIDREKLALEAWPRIATALEQHAQMNFAMIKAYNEYVTTPRWKLWLRGIAGALFPPPEEPPSPADHSTDDPERTKTFDIPRLY